MRWRFTTIHLDTTYTLNCYTLSGMIDVTFNRNVNHFCFRTFSYAANNLHSIICDNPASFWLVLYGLSAIFLTKHNSKLLRSNPSTKLYVLAFRTNARAFSSARWGFWAVRYRKMPWDCRNKLLTTNLQLRRFFKSIWSLLDIQLGISNYQIWS